MDQSMGHYVQTGQKQQNNMSVIGSFVVGALENIAKLFTYQEPR